LFHPRLAGTYYDMGFQYGTILYKHGFRVQEQSGDRLRLGKECEKEVKRVFPQILEEILGFADACHSSYEHLAAMIFSVGAFKPPGAACSVFAAANSSDVVFGRNYDFYYSFKEKSESYLTMPKDGYWSVGNSSGIFVGREDGINQEGLAVAMTAVRPITIKPGINFALTTRYILDKCATMEEGLRILSDVHFSTTNNYLLVDREGNMAVVEASPNKVMERRPEQSDNFIVCTNQFMRPEMLEMENQKERPPDSPHRYTAIYEAIKQKKGRIDVKTAQKILKDHKGYVCSHIESIQLGTLWSVVATLRKLRIFRAEGHPCRTKYKIDTRLKPRGS